MQNKVGSNAFLKYFNLVIILGDPNCCATECKCGDGCKCENCPTKKKGKYHYMKLWLILEAELIFYTIFNVRLL